MSSVSNPLHPSVNCFLRTIGSSFVPSVAALTIDQRCPRFLFPTSRWLRNGSVPSARWTFLSAAVCTLPRHTTRESELDQSPLVRSARQRVRKKLRPQRQESTKRQRRWLKCKKRHWAERNLLVFNKVWVRNMFDAWKLNFTSTSLLRSCNFWVQYYIID